MKTYQDIDYTVVSDRYLCSSDVKDDHPQAMYIFQQDDGHWAYCSTHAGWGRYIAHLREEHAAKVRGRSYMLSHLATRCQAAEWARCNPACYDLHRKRRMLEKVEKGEACDYCITHPITPPGTFYAQAV